MDVLIGLVILGCSLAGLFWGAVRMATLVTALIGSIVAARFVAPQALALMVAQRDPAGHHQAVAALVVGAVAGALILVAGRGLRRGVEVLRLAWLDRLAGGAIAAAMAAAVVAVMLALAAGGGMTVSSPWALRLATFGRSLLALQQAPSNSATPSATPTNATSNGQHPR